MKKKGILIAIAGVVVLAALGIFFFVSNKEEGYRMMQVYQVSGQATIERENIGLMDAFENLNLLTGDKVEVAAESFMRLKVDEDKFVFAEAGSEFKIKATGSENSGKTNIELEKGAVTVEVQNKLADDEAFEVTTPNSVMAIRGTVFRISADVDEAGEPITRISILEGEVSVQKKDENGNLTEEQSIVSGSEAIIYKEADEVKITIVDEISITEFPVEVLEFLKEISTERRELVISSEEIQNLIEKLEGDSEEGDSQEEPEKGDSEEGDSQEGEPEQDDSEANDSQEEDVQENEADDTTTYTVTFMYQGKVFATQTVKAGEMVSKPKLMPAPSGKWNFDFSTPIESDIVIEFVE